MQFQADLLACRSSGRSYRNDRAGAAYLAGLAVGFWKNSDDLASQWRTRAPLRAGDAAASRVRELRARWDAGARAGKRVGVKKFSVGRTDTISPARRGPAEGASEMPYRPACSMTVRCPCDAHRGTEDHVAQIVPVVMDTRGGHIAATIVAGTPAFHP